MSTRGHNILNPYVEEIERLTGLKLRINYANEGYKLETEDGSKSYGPRDTVGKMKIFLQGTINGCRLLNEGRNTEK